MISIPANLHWAFRAEPGDWSCRRRVAPSRALIVPQIQTTLVLQRHDIAVSEAYSMGMSRRRGATTETAQAREESRPWTGRSYTHGVGFWDET